MRTFSEAISTHDAIKRSYDMALEAAAQIKGMSATELEYFICKNCRAYFMWTHLKVEKEAGDFEDRTADDSAIVSFRMSDVQLDLLNKFEARMEEGKKFSQAVMKCRRAQVSTLYLAIGYHMIRFHENKKGLVFADVLDTSRKLRRILDIFYQFDTLGGKPNFGKKTLGEGMYLHHSGADQTMTGNNSFILLGSGEQKNPGIAGAVDFFVWSEASLTSDAIKNWTTIAPALKGAMFSVFESTPSLTGKDEIIFPKFENPSANCDTTFISPFDIEGYRINDEEQIRNFVPYDDHVLYGKEREIINSTGADISQMLWRRYKLDELRNANAFRQMFPLSIEEAFYSGVGIFFHKDLIEGTRPVNPLTGANYTFSEQSNGNVTCTRDQVGAWTIWKPCAPGGKYLVAADASEGKTADKDNRDPDYSTAMIFSLGQTLEEVGILRDRIPAEIFGEQVLAVARHYNDAFIVPERNGPGLAMLSRILPTYNNVYRQQKMQGGTFISTQDYGFYSTTLTKPHALSCLMMALREKRIVLNSDIARVELTKFVQCGVRYAASAGFHDDTVTCLWLLAVAVAQMPNLCMTDDLMFQQTRGQGMPYVPKIERESVPI